MYSGNDYSGGISGLLFPIAVIISLFAVILPFIPVIASDQPEIIGIAHRESAIMEDSDVFEQAWHFWWVSNAIEKGLDPRFCPLIYAPEGVSLVYDHIGWDDTLLFAVLGIGKGNPALAHTFSLLLGTLLTAVFGWLLARSWGADRYGALFTALALAWLPSRTAHLLQHYQIANCWTLPASLWLVRKYLDGEGNSGVLILYTAVLTMASFQSPFIAIFAVLGIPATTFAINGSWKKSGMLAAGAAVAAFLTAIFIFTSRGDSTSPFICWREAIYWAAEPQSFVLPSPFGPAGYFFGIPERFSWMSNTAEGVVTPGLTVIAAFAFLAWKKKNWRLPAVFFVLCIFALGPELRIFGRPLGIPLPFRIMQLFPVLDGIRAPSRFAIPAGIFAAVGAGMGISIMKGKFKLLFFSLLAFELFVPAFKTLGTEIPSACLDIPNDRVVLELPVDNIIRKYSWFQTGSGYSRRYALMARLPELAPENELIQESLENGYVLVYHRWLFGEQDRVRLDSIYSELFPDGSVTDSVWVYEGDGAL